MEQSKDSASGSGEGKVCTMPVQISGDMCLCCTSGVNSSFYMVINI